MKNLVLTIFLVGSVSVICQAQVLKPVNVKGKYGYVDKKGKFVVPPKFDTAFPFAGKLARVGIINKESPEVRGHPDYKWGFIDQSGKLIVPLQYDLARDLSQGLAAVAIFDKTEVGRRFGRQENFRWGFVDERGAFVVEVQYWNVGDFSEGLAAVDVGMAERSTCGRQQKYGYIDKTGKIVIEPRFGLAGPFKNGRARVGIGWTEYVGRCLCCAPQFRGDWGTVDRNGNFMPEKR
jgi:hypothetical protein